MLNILVISVKELRKINAIRGDRELQVPTTMMYAMHVVVVYDEDMRTFDVVKDRHAKPEKGLPLPSLGTWLHSRYTQANDAYALQDLLDSTENTNA